MERKREGQKRGIEKETEGKGERERVERAREGRRRAGEQQFIVSHFINLTFFPYSLFFFFYRHYRTRETRVTWRW